MPTSYNANKGSVEIMVVKKSGEGEITAPTIKRITIEYLRVLFMKVPVRIPNEARI
jgi:hypothetical protein